jgi:hypothetical protein
MCTAAALFWIVLHHCKGRVDSFAKATIVHFLERIPKAVRPEYRATISGVISMCIIYNPALVIASLEERGLTGALVLQHTCEASVA